jgi:hypothetical protein
LNVISKNIIKTMLEKKVDGRKFNVVIKDVVENLNPMKDN